MTYLSIKYIHIISAFLLFGTGLGSAFYKSMADKSGNIHHIAHTNKLVVLADWIFTTPTIIIQPLSGFYLMYLANISLTTSWILISVILYTIAGICWMIVVYLQIQMKKISMLSMLNNKPLPSQYWLHAKQWFYLGVIAFIAIIFVIFLMVIKI